MFEQEYDIDSLQKITPRGMKFEMLVTPRYVEHYTAAKYEALTINLLSHQMAKDSVFVDVGAHFGFYSLVAGHMQNVKKIISFEPTPMIFDVLNRNIQRNTIQNIDTYNYAVSDENGEKVFRIAEASDSCGFYEHVNCDIKEEIAVKAVTLDSMLRDLVDAGQLVIKIDAEGHEMNILDGMRETIVRWYPKLKLVVEYNPGMLKNAGREPGELVSRLFSFGFQVYLINDSSGVIKKIDGSQINNHYEELDDIHAPSGYGNLYCVPFQNARSILIFSHDSNLGGAEKTLVPLVADLTQKDVICTVVLPSDHSLKPQLEEAGANTLIFPFEWWSSAYKLETETWNNVLVNNFGNVIENLLPKIKEINPDVIITNTVVIPWGAICAFFLNKPHIWYVHEYGGADHGLQFFYPKQLVAKYIESSSNIVITNSQDITKYFFGESSEKIQIIHEILDNSDVVDAFTPKKPFFFLPDALKLTLIGTLIKGKGQIDALYAVKELLDAGEKIELVLAGYASDPEYFEILNVLIKQNNLQSVVHIVHFMENPFPLFQEADVFLMCSSNEAFGRVTVEAMRFGKPVIGTNSGGTPEIVTDGVTGLLYSPGNYQELAAKIKILIDHPSMRTQIGQAAAAFANSHFSRDEATSKFFEVLKSVEHVNNGSSRDFIDWVLEMLQQHTKVKELNVVHALQKKDQETNELIAQKDQDLSALMAQKDQELKNVFDVVAQKDQEIKNVCDVVAQKDQDSRKLQARMMDLEQAYGSAEVQLADFEFMNSSLKMQFNELETVTQSLQTQVVQRDEAVRSAHSQYVDVRIELRNMEMEMIGYYLSSSWRLTRPLRRIKHIYHKVFRK